MARKLLASVIIAPKSDFREFGIKKPGRQTIVVSPGQLKELQRRRIVVAVEGSRTAEGDILSKIEERELQEETRTLKEGRASQVISLKAGPGTVIKKDVAKEQELKRARQERIKSLIQKRKGTTMVQETVIKQKETRPSISKVLKRAGQKVSDVLIFFPGGQFKVAKDPESFGRATETAQEVTALEERKKIREKVTSGASRIQKGVLKFVDPKSADILEQQEQASIRLAKIQKQRGLDKASVKFQELSSEIQKENVQLNQEIKEFNKQIEGGKFGQAEFQERRRDLEQRELDIREKRGELAGLAMKFGRSLRKAKPGEFTFKTDEQGKPILAEKGDFILEPIEKDPLIKAERELERSQIELGRIRTTGSTGQKLRLLTGQAVSTIATLPTQLAGDIIAPEQAGAEFIESGKALATSIKQTEKLTEAEKGQVGLGLTALGTTLVAPVAIKGGIKGLSVTTKAVTKKLPKLSKVTDVKIESIGQLRKVQKFGETEVFEGEALAKVKVKRFGLFTKELKVASQIDLITEPGTNIILFKGQLKQQGSLEDSQNQNCQT